MKKETLIKKHEMIYGNPKPDLHITVKNHFNHIFLILITMKQTMKLEKD